MALNIKNRQVEHLAAEVAGLTGETKTEAVRRAHILRFLERDVWPLVPKGQAGRRLTRKEENDILGYGPR